MSFFEDAVLGAKNITAAVGERTGRVVDISRLRLSAAEINKEITKRYEALGRMVFDARKAGTDVNGLIDECVRSVDALYTRLDDVNGKIAKLKDKKYCSTCGALVERSALFCSRCGSPVEKPESASAQDAAPEAEEAFDGFTQSAKEKAEDIFGAVEEKAKDIKDAAQEKAQDLKDTAAEKVDDIFDAVEDAVDDIADVLSGDED